MKISMAWGALGALVFALSAHAATPAKGAAAEVPIPDIPYTKFVLKNGLTALVHEDRKLPIVAVNTW